MLREIIPLFASCQDCTSAEARRTSTIWYQESTKGLYFLPYGAADLFMKTPEFPNPGHRKHSSLTSASSLQAYAIKISSPNRNLN